MYLTLSHLEGFSPFTEFFVVKYTLQNVFYPFFSVQFWVGLVYSSCAAITATLSLPRVFVGHPRPVLCARQKITLHSSLPPAPGNLYSTFCL